jgi:hypothetical protein
MPGSRRRHPDHFAGKRFFKLTYGNLTQYVGERGRRGKKLPRGFQNVDRLESEAARSGAPGARPISANE